jgi:hypothetical protein
VIGEALVVAGLQLSCAWHAGQDTMRYDPKLSVLRLSPNPPNRVGDSRSGTARQVPF